MEHQDFTDQTSSTLDVEAGLPPADPALDDAKYPGVPDADPADELEAPGEANEEGSPDLPAWEFPVGARIPG